MLIVLRKKCVKIVVCYRLQTEGVVKLVWFDPTKVLLIKISPVWRFLVSGIKLQANASSLFIWSPARPK